MQHAGCGQANQSDGSHEKVAFERVVPEDGRARMKKTDHKYQWHGRNEQRSQSAPQVIDQRLRPTEMTDCQAIRTAHLPKQLDGKEADRDRLCRRGECQCRLVIAGDGAQSPTEEGTHQWNRSGSRQR